MVIAELMSQRLFPSLFLTFSSLILPRSSCMESFVKREHKNRGRYSEYYKLPKKYPLAIYILSRFSALKLRIEFCTGVFVRTYLRFVRNIKKQV